jgi:hypothetical protein
VRGEKETTKCTKLHERQGDLKAGEQVRTNGKKLNRQDAKSAKGIQEGCIFLNRILQRSSLANLASWRFKSLCTTSYVKMS